MFQFEKTLQTYFVVHVV